MLHEINAQLSRYIKERGQQAAYQQQLDQLHIEKEQMEAQLVELEQRLRQEFQDVKNLESPGPKRFVVKISGKLEANYAQEYAEYQEALNARDVQVSLLCDLNRNIEQLGHKLDQMGDIDPSYHELIQLKEEILRQHPECAGAAYRRQLEAVSGLETNHALLDKTVQLGKKADHILSCMLKNLQKAYRRIKSNYQDGIAAIDLAESQALQAKSLLHEFVQTVQAVQERTHFAISQDLVCFQRFYAAFQKAIHIPYKTKYPPKPWEFWGTYQQEVYFPVPSTFGVNVAIKASIQLIQDTREKFGAIQTSLRHRLNMLSLRLESAEQERLRLLEETGMEDQ